MKNLFGRQLWAALVLCAGIAFTGCEDDPTPTSSFCYEPLPSFAAYDTLVGANRINTTNSDGLYEVDLGFTFDFCGESFTKLYLTYDYGATFTYTATGNSLDATGYELVTWGALSLESKWGTLPDGSHGEISRVMTSTTGAAGNRICTIEFRELKYEPSDGEDEFTVSYKIKLYENGNKVVYHYGPADVTVDFASNIWEFMSVGLYATSGSNGAFLSGDPVAPASSSSPGLDGLSTWPADGTMYVFY